MVLRWLQRCYINSGIYNLISIFECFVYFVVGKKVKVDFVLENVIDLGRYEIDSVFLNFFVFLGFSFVK